jgi:type IV pilus assembly protein PilO
MKKTKIDFTEIIEKVKELNPKEYYAWPLAAQVGAGTLAMLTVIVAGTVFFLMPKKDEVTAAINKEESLKQEFIDKKRRAINLPLYQKQLDEVTKDSDTLLKQLPDKSQIDKLLIDINQAALGRELQVELFKPSAEKINDFYAELPIDIKVTGTYEAIGNFTSDMAQLSRVVLFTDMDITTKNGLVTMSALIKTFRYLDQEEIEEKAKQKAQEEKKKKKAKASDSAKKDA